MFTRLMHGSSNLAGDLLFHNLRTGLHFRSRDISKCPFNRLTPNDPYVCRTTPLTSKRCILYIYSSNIGTEYFKHALYSPFFSLQNAVCFIMLTCLVPELFTFYIQDVLKLKKKNNSSVKGLKSDSNDDNFTFIITYIAAVVSYLLWTNLN